MSSIVNKYNIYINTDQRLSGDSNSFKIKLDRPILITNSKNRLEAQVVNIEYPYSFYQVNATNNTLNVRLNSTTLTISITHGNYAITNLLTELKNEILSAFGLGSLQLNFTYDKFSGKVRIDLLDPIYTTAEFFFAGTTIGKMCGFTNNITITSIGSASSNGFVNVNPITSIYLRSDICASNFDMESIVVENEISDILCKIPIRTQPNTYIYHNQPYDDRIYLNVQTLDIMHFYVTSNQNKQVLYNHELDWAFQLIIYEVEKPDVSMMDKIDTFQMNPVLLEQQRQELINQLEVLKKSMDNVDDGDGASAEKS